MSILNTLDEDKKYNIEIIVMGLNAKIEEFSKYTKKTPENIIIINKINNLTAMLTLFREHYYYQTDKIVGAVDINLLSKVDFGEKNIERSIERKNAIVKSVKMLCKASNAYFYGNAEKSLKEKDLLHFYADYEKYVKKCTGQNDYKNAGKAPSIFNITIKHIKTFFGKDRKEEEIASIKIPRFASDESILIDVGQLTGNKSFDNFFVKIYPNKVSLDGALFGHNVNWELKSTDTSPVTSTTTLRPKIEPTTQVDTPPIKSAEKVPEKPVEEKKVVASPPVATPTPPAKKDIVEPSTPVEVDDDEPPSFDDLQDVDDDEGQDNEQEYL